jgi:hypothetical protein
MSHKLPRTLQAVPNTLHARLEIADAIGKLNTADQEDWAQRRREALIALRRDVEKLREELRTVSRDFLTLFLTELRKAGFNPDEPRVPAGNPQGGQWTKEGDSGSADRGSIQWRTGFGTPAIPNGQKRGTFETWSRTIREQR